MVGEIETLIVFDILQLKEDFKIDSKICCSFLELPGEYIICGQGEGIALYDRKTNILDLLMKDAHNGMVYCFLKITDNIFASSSVETSIKIWKLCKK